MNGNDKVNAVNRYNKNSKIQPMNFMKSNCDHYIVSNITVYDIRTGEAIYRTNSNGRLLFVTHDTESSTLFIEYLDPDLYIVREFNLGQDITYTMNNVQFAISD